MVRTWKEAVAEHKAAKLADVAAKTLIGVCPSYPDGKHRADFPTPLPRGGLMSPCVCGYQMFRRNLYTNGPSMPGDAE